MAWLLADAAERCLTGDQRTMVFVELGCGESYLAIERILRIVVGNGFPLPLPRWWPSQNGWVYTPAAPRNGCCGTWSYGFVRWDPTSKRDSVPIDVQPVLVWLSRGTTEARRMPSGGSGYPADTAAKFHNTRGCRYDLSRPSWTAGRRGAVCETGAGGIV